MRPSGNAQGEGVQNLSGERVARPRPRFCACVVKIENSIYQRPPPVCHRGRFSRLLARAGARNRRYPPPILDGSEQGNFRRIYSTSGNGDISHGNGPILDVPGKYEGLHAQRVTRPKYGVFSKKIITPGNRAFSRVRTVGRFNPAPVPERFPPQLFQRYRLQTG